MNEQIEKLIAETKKYVSENRTRFSKFDFIKQLKYISDIHNFINFNAQYGLSKDYLVRIKAIKLVLADLNLIGL